MAHVFIEQRSSGLSSLAFDGAVRFIFINAHRYTGLPCIASAIAFVVFGICSGCDATPGLFGWWVGISDALTTHHTLDHRINRFLGCATVLDVPPIAALQLDVRLIAPAGLGGRFHEPHGEA
jgi:hypothetical protein